MKYLILLTLLIPNLTIAEPAEQLPTRVAAWVTGYSSTPDQTDDTPEIMADGSRTRWGSIACPRKYEFDTIVLVAGEEFVCRDRMAKKNDGKFDIFFESTRSAKNFGRHRTELFIYE